MQEKNSSITSTRDAVFLHLLKMLGLLLVKLAAWSDTWFIHRSGSYLWAESYIRIMQFC